MSKKANPAILGGFVIGAIALMMVSVLLLGGHSFFEKRTECVAYFDENISGLDIGAPVEYQGVRLGTVTGIRLECNLETREFFRPVRFQLEEKRIRYIGQAQGFSTAEALEQLVQQHGLRAQLANQSLLTGKLKMDLSNHTNTPIQRKNRDSDIWEMPTIPSPLEAVTQKLTDLPFAEIVQEIREAVVGLSDMVQSTKEAGTMEHLGSTLEHLSHVLGALESRVAPMADQGGALMKSATLSLDELRTMIQTVGDETQPILAALNETIEQINGMLDPGSARRGELSRLLTDIRETSVSLRNFLDYLEQHPDALLRGKQP